MLAATEGHEQTLLPAKPRPYVLDAVAVARVIRVPTDQADGFRR